MKILCLFFWLSLIIFINVVSPTPTTIPVCFLLVFFSLFSTCFLLSKKIKTNILISLFLVSLLLFLYFHQLTTLNFSLILAFFCSIFFLARQSTS